MNLVALAEGAGASWQQLRVDQARDVSFVGGAIGSIVRNDGNTHVILYSQCGPAIATCRSRPFVKAGAEVITELPLLHRQGWVPAGKTGKFSCRGRFFVTELLLNFFLF